LNVCEATKELEFPWTILKGVTTDGAANVIGKETGSMGRFRQEMDKQSSESNVELHCISHQQSLCGRTFWFEHVMKIIVSVVIFI
jgi:hypothetical protein